jgi:hypothetical protein
MEQENLNKSEYCENLVSINTIADGNCLIHSILKSCYKDYQNNSDVSFRKDTAIEYRKKLSEYILQPNSEYSSKEEVSYMVRKSYKTDSARNFLDFLRTMYNYKNKSIQYPYEPLSLEELIRYNTESIAQYKNEYKQYINNIKSKIENNDNNTIKIPYIERYNILINDENEALDVEKVKTIAKELKDLYNEFEGFIDNYVKQIRDFLEYIMNYELYIPTNFNEGVIEYIFENVKNMDDETIEEVRKTLPKGIYSNYNFNSNLFTISEGAPLVKFEYEYNELEGIVKLGDIPSHINSRKFIGDADGMIYIPHILNINLIIINFEKCSVIAIYENKNSEYYVIVNNIDNVHFETVGVIDNNGYIETLFQKTHPLIQECFKKEGKLNLQCLIREVSIEDKIRKAFGDRIEKFRLLEQENKYAYIVLKELKTTHRFYINITGDVVEGYVPERIKFKLKNII